MQSNDIRVVSLNVNGLNNPIKRSKVLAKFKKEKMQVIYLQETHLTKQEHEKFRKLGYNNIFYSTFLKQSNRRGVAILISNSVKFEFHKEICDKEGRYVIVKGKLEDQTVTLINVYVPPDSGKSTYEKIFDVINKEAEGVWLCGGDVNLTLNYNLDTTSINRSKEHISKYVNIMMAELGIIDIWRELHPMERDYTHYSAPHQMYSRIDLYLMNKEEVHRVKECKIGVTDLSDHSAIYLTLHLNSRKKNTVWRLNVGILNNMGVVESTKRDINTYLEENDNGEVEPTILWDAMKAVLRGKLIAQTSYMKKARLEIYQKRIGKLKDLEQQHKTMGNPEILDQIKETRKKIDEMLLEEVEKKTRFVKQTYYEGGSKATKMLARRLKKQQAINNIHKIRDPETNNLLYEPEAIEKVFENYYRTLYTQPPAAREEEMELLLNSLDLPSLGTSQNKMLNASITIEEIEEAIQKTKNNKSPGTDGFSSEFFKTFKEELMPLLQASFNYTLKKGKIPPSWKEAVISVIHKEGKDKEYCSNYRPISLLNVDYKLYTSIIAKRFESFMSDLIDECQTGFIIERQTQDNIRRALHLVDEIQKTKTSAMLVSIDAEKAFDSVNWLYLYKVMERLGFNEKSVQIIKTLYQEPSARVKINGSLSRSFKLERSTRQGCCLSPTLFALFIEPLAQLIRDSEEIEGVKIKHNEHKVGLFADDILIYLRDPEETLPRLMRILEEHGRYSGYKLNVTKTQILSLNYNPSHIIRETYKLNWDLEMVKYLGVNITKERDKLYEANYGSINQGIKGDLDRWSVLCLDFSSRIEIIKMNVLPRLLYLFQSLPVTVPQTQFDEWDKCISRFIWGGKRPRIRFETLQLPKEKGGMALPNLKEYYHAAQLRFLVCWCRPGYEAKWKGIELDQGEGRIQNLLANKISKKRMETELSPITKFTIEIWNDIVKKYKLEDERKILGWLTHDPNFKPGFEDQGFKQWERKGMTAVCTLLVDGQMRSFEDLRLTYDLDKHEFYRYLQIRDYYTKKIKMESMNPLIRIMVQAYNNKKCRVISAVYQGLMTSKGTSTMYIKEKWEKGFGEQIDEKDWFNICKTQCTATSSRVWREFCWKNVTRYFITPKIRGRVAAEKQPCWRLCGNMDADHEHVFWNCPNIDKYWDDVWSVIKDVLKYDIPKTSMILYLGNLTHENIHGDDLYLVKVLLAASKKAITRLWCNSNPPTCEQWLCIVEELYVMERFTHRLRIQEELFLEKWVKWTEYKTQQNDTTVD